MVIPLDDARSMYGGSAPLADSGRGVTSPNFARILSQNPSNRCRMQANILAAIGRTPRVRLRHVAKGLSVPVYVKVESQNPGGSVKDRVAVAMIQEAERRGWLRPGGTIIEATAGNTGVGLAMVAAVKGYRCMFVLPDKMSQEEI